MWLGLRGMMLTLIVQYRIFSRRASLPKVYEWPAKDECTGSTDWLQIRGEVAEAQSE